MFKQVRFSKTMWFNAIGFIVAIAGPILEANGYTGIVPPSLSLFILPATYLVNMVLRYFFTNSSLRSG